MGMRETFQIIIDVATENSQKSLKGLRSEVSKTEGGFNKFKVGVSSGMDFVKDHAAAFALGAGTALVGFGIKAVAAFEDTAKAALDLSAATGLAVEDASRWIAVGDDFQISAETLTSSIGKIGKTLDADKWSKYGIATRNAGGQARDANDILIESLAMLSNIENGTERARVGNELFGKGYAALSPMIGHTTDEYKKMLGTVEAGQVITKSEAEQAEQMRLAQDNLSDALKEVELAAGKAATKLAPLLKFVAEVASSTVVWGDTGQAVDAYSASLDKNSKLAHTSEGLARAHANAFLDLREELTNNISGFDAFGRVIEGYGPNFDDAGDRTRNAFKDLLDKQGPQKAQELLDALKRLYSGGTQAEKDWVDQLGIGQSQLDKWQAKILAVDPNIKSLAGSTKDLGDQAAKAAADEVEHAKQLDIVTNSINDAKIATVELDQAYQHYRDELTNEQALLDTKQAFDDYTESVKKNGGESDITAEKLITLKGKLLDYAEQLGGLPPEAVTMVMAQVDQGSIDSAEAALKVLFLAAPSHSRAYSISRSKPLKPLTLDDVPHKAGGGITKPGLTLVGEQGPELVMMNGGENVLTASQTASAMVGGGSSSGIGSGTSINLTVNAGLGTDGNAVGQQIVNMLKQYQRTNGPFDFTSR
jgi:hypothetical protein